MKLRVYLCSILTEKEIRVYEDVWRDNLCPTRQELIDVIRFQWFENNYSCDHNRADFFGFPDSGDESKFNCTSDIVEVVCINEVLPDDSERFLLSGDSSKVFPLNLNCQSS